MGSSGGGGTPRAPNMPAPPGGMISAQGSTAPFAPNYTSFLPTDSNAMATGLTPEMLASINAPPPPPPVQQAAAGPGMDQNAMRTMLTQMLAQRQQMNHPLIRGITDQMSGRGPGYGQGISAGGGSQGGGYSTSGGYQGGLGGAYGGNTVGGGFSGSGKGWGGTGSIGGFGGFGKGWGAGGNTSASQGKGGLGGGGKKK